MKWFLRCCWSSQIFLLNFHHFLNISSYSQWVSPLSLWDFPFNQWVSPFSLWVFPFSQWVFPFGQRDFPFSQWVSPLSQWVSPLSLWVFLFSQWDFLFGQWDFLFSQWVSSIVLNVSLISINATNYITPFPCFPLPYLGVLPPEWSPAWTKSWYELLLLFRFYWHFTTSFRYAAIFWTRQLSVWLSMASFSYAMLLLGQLYQFRFEKFQMSILL